MHVTRRAVRQVFWRAAAAMELGEMQEAADGFDEYFTMVAEGVATAEHPLGTAYGTFMSSNLVSQIWFGSTGLMDGRWAVGGRWVGGGCTVVLLHWIPLHRVRHLDCTGLGLAR